MVYSGSRTKDMRKYGLQWDRSRTKDMRKYGLQWE